MSSATYHQVTVEGGNVHLGDQHLNQHFYQTFVLDGASAIDVETLRVGLALTARQCESIKTTLCLTGPTVPPLEELHCDITDLQAGMCTLDMLLEDSAGSASCAPSSSQEALKSLIQRIDKYKETLGRIEEHIRRWSGAEEDLPRDIDSCSGDILQWRQQLSTIRTNINITVALLHWSSIQDLRHQTAQQATLMMQQLTGIVEELERQRLRGLPGAAPLSLENVTKLSDSELDGNRVSHYIGMTDDDRTTILAPSMQVSTLQPCAASDASTYLTAAERLVFSSRSSAMPAGTQVLVDGVPGMRTFRHVLDPQSTVEDIKHEICEMTSTPCALLVIAHNGRPLPARSRFSECGVAPFSKLTCSNPEPTSHIHCQRCAVRVVFDHSLTKTNERVGDLQVALGASHPNNQRWIYLIRQVHPSRDAGLLLYICNRTVLVYGELPPHLSSDEQSRKSPLFTSDLTSSEKETFDLYFSRILRITTYNIRSAWRSIIRSTKLSRSFQLTFDGYSLEAQRRNADGFTGVAWLDGRPYVKYLDVSTGQTTTNSEDPEKERRYSRSGVLWPRSWSSLYGLPTQHPEEDDSTSPQNHYTLFTTPSRKSFMKRSQTR